MHRNVVRLPWRALSQCHPAAQSSRLARGLASYLPALSQQRSFTISPALYKKKDKTKKNPAPEQESSPSTVSEDPFDLSHLHSGISTAVSRLKEDLSKLRAGGRFNTASLEGLKVQLSKDSHESIKLRDLAQVVPKGGRMVTILVAEEEVSFTVVTVVCSTGFLLTFSR